MATSPEPGDFKGYIQVYTGNGKGKTTAALGLALRAAGRGLRTFIGQFLKAQPTGEIEAVKKLAPLITVEQFGRAGFIQVSEELEEADLELAARGLRRSGQAMRSGEFRIVVLDEINTAVHFKLLPEADVLELMAKKPDDVELILTGRYAPESFLERADLVTEMKPLKHYYDRGIRAREGIEK